MALRITRDCICCDICIPECPNEAIVLGPEVCEILPERCTECAGHYSEPQCRLVCPVDAIVADPDHRESPDALMEKYRRLVRPE